MLLSCVQEIGLMCCSKNYKTFAVNILNSLDLSKAFLTQIVTWVSLQNNLFHNAFCNKLSWNSDQNPEDKVWIERNHESLGEWLHYYEPLIDDIHWEVGIDTPPAKGC